MKVRYRVRRAFCGARRFSRRSRERRRCTAGSGRRPTSPPISRRSAGGRPYSGDAEAQVQSRHRQRHVRLRSVRPDPLYGRTIDVSGNVSEGHITLDLPGDGRFHRARHARRQRRDLRNRDHQGHFYSFLAKVKSSP